MNMRLNYETHKVHGNDDYEQMYLKSELYHISLLYEHPQIKNDFINADVDEKIRIYTTTQGLTTEQFRELLKYYPIKHLSKLEKALG